MVSELYLNRNFTRQKRDESSVHSFIHSNKHLLSVQKYRQKPALAVVKVNHTQIVSWGNL